MATYVVSAIGPDQVVARLAVPDPGDYNTQYCSFTYAEYVKATNSNPQHGDRIDVVRSGREYGILGLTPEWK